MTKPGRLIVPVDGSECALRALAVACSRFRRGGYSELVVLHAQQPLPTSRFVTRGMIRQHQEQASNEAFSKARRLVEKLKVPATFTAVIDMPAAAIAGSARRGDEIVMGTRGLGRIGGLVLGSTATKVVHLAKVPVTLVK